MAIRLCPGSACGAGPAPARRRAGEIRQAGRPSQRGRGHPFKLRGMGLGGV